MAGGAGGSGTFRDDIVNLLIDDRVAEHLSDRMATRFHSLAQKTKGGVVGPNGELGANPLTKNQWGGKGIIKFAPTDNEIVQGIKQQISLFTWESPDGLPHYVTVDVGRLAAGVGGPGADGTRGGLTVVSPISAQGQGSVGGGSWPAGQDAAGNPLYYRGVAQVLIGTPGTMQDPFFIDINRGQRFTVVASYVAVTAQMLGPPIDEQTGNVVIPLNATTGVLGTLPYVSGSLAVYATLGMAAAPSLAPVLYTQYIDNTTDAGNTTSQYIRIIPPRANYLLPVLFLNTGASTLTIFFFDAHGNTLSGTGALTILSSTAVLPMAIPEDAYGVFLVGVAGKQPNFRLIYQLSV